MSSSHSINIKLDSNKKLIFRNVIKVLIDAGWQIEKDNKIVYLPIGDDDMFEWTSSEMKLDEFLMIVDKKELENETIGIELFWNNTDIGGHILLFNDRTISIDFSINTKYLDKERNLADVNWYLEKIIPAISNEFHMMQYSFEFIY